MRVTEKSFYSKYLILNLLAIKQLQNYKGIKSNFLVTLFFCAFLFLNGCIQYEFIPRKYRTRIRNTYLKESYQERNPFQLQYLKTDKQLTFLGNNSHHLYKDSILIFYPHLSVYDSLNEVQARKLLQENMVRSLNKSKEDTLKPILIKLPFPDVSHTSKKTYREKMQYSMLKGIEVGLNKHNFQTEELSIQDIKKINESMRQLIRRKENTIDDTLLSILNRYPQKYFLLTTGNIYLDKTEKEYKTDIKNYNLIAIPVQIISFPLNVLTLWAFPGLIFIFPPKKSCMRLTVSILDKSKKKVLFYDIKQYPENKFIIPEVLEYEIKEMVKKFFNIPASNKKQ